MYVYIWVYMGYIKLFGGLWRIVEERWFGIDCKRFESLPLLRTVVSGGLVNTYGSCLERILPLPGV